MFGDRIKDFRKKKGFKTKQFADLVGISQGALSGIENNKSNPSAETLSAIVQHTDINPEWLLTGNGPPYIEERAGPPGDQVPQEPMPISPETPGALGFGQAAEMLAAIYNGGNPTAIRAISASLAALAAIRPTAHGPPCLQQSEFQRLQQECEEVKKRLAAIENPPPSVVNE